MTKGKPKETKIKFILFDFFGVLYRDGIDQVMLNLAKRLRDQGFLTVIFSNVSAERFEELQAEYQLDSYFDEHFTSSALGYLKPDSEAFKRVLEELKADSEEVIFVDDSRENVAAAKKLGITGLAFESEGQVREKLKRILGYFQPP